MSNEQEPVNLSRESAGQAAGFSEARRRWVKGSLWTAPVLLTLPRFSSAVESNQHCAVQTNLNEAQAINPSNYLVVSRPTYELQGTNPVVTVVYGGPSPVTSTPPTETDWCGSGDWHDITNWGSTYTATCNESNNVESFSDGINLPYSAINPGTANVIVHAGTLGNGSTVGIGPASGVYVFPDANGATGSCWTSAMPGISPPQ
jgi:hypothetical protein